MVNYIVTEFEKVNKPNPVNRRELIEILADIKNGKYETLVSACRLATDKDSLEFAKIQLPLFTPTGVFNYRSIAGMEKYNGLICLDIDHIEDPVALKKRAVKLDYVFAAFITPSGKGLKVLIKSKANPENYKIVEQEIASAFAHDAGAERDTRCRDISRVQYVSYDPDLYLNIDSSVL